VERLRISIHGAVQGVGFRPFAYRLAASLRIRGWIRNTPQGVLIEAEGERQELEQFLSRLQGERPALASIHGLETAYLDPMGYQSFSIVESDASLESSVWIMPDIATCPTCVSEILDPANRRYRYPFTNCVNCGPRFTIQEGIPYDRSSTTMRIFRMCAECRAEYEDAGNRRFHTEPNACGRCGPRLELWDPAGKALAGGEDALERAVKELREGKIVAVKGLGGFHLMTDARNGTAVRALRERKHREEKPLALMVPDLDWARRLCSVSEPEERLLSSPEAPIVLLRSWSREIAPEVAPRNPYLGVMLPYTPLHHLLMRDLGFPVVATSGNLLDAPILFEEREALAKLGSVADYFLVHNRPIARHADDSIVRLIAGRPCLLRRSRGYAPLPFEVRSELPAAAAFGAQLKSAVAFSRGREIFVSQHIGDLGNSETAETFGIITERLPGLLGLQTRVAAYDLHPDYASTQAALKSGLRGVRVQHHLAHVLSCMAENEVEYPFLGVAWDGTGMGTDGTVWGGEFLAVEETHWKRIASFRRFRLPGSERAVREPRRIALALLYEIFGDAVEERETAGQFSPEEKEVLLEIIRKGFYSPYTSSAGRLFDGVASLLGLRQRASFEGQAAMEVEFAAEESSAEGAYAFGCQQEEILRIDWEPVIRAILEDRKKGLPAADAARKFHHALAEAVSLVCERAGFERVVLSGGCFQNKLLAEKTIEVLRRKGFRPYWHQRIPPNDGGICVGQVMEASRVCHPKEAEHVSCGPG
jgi:hydrogenase maturation protein HypF